jgi:hypothetical protein
LASSLAYKENPKGCVAIYSHLNETRGGYNSKFITRMFTVGPMEFMTTKDNIGERNA